MGIARCFQKRAAVVFGNTNPKRFLACRRAMILERVASNFDARRPILLMITGSIELTEAMASGRLLDMPRFGVYW